MGKQSKFVGLLPLAGVLILGTAAYGGSIRYDLPNLLGEHSFDGSFNLFNVAQVVDTPFQFYAVEEARLVVVGRVRPGQARGDGIIREATSFELPPRVSARPNFANSIEIQTEPTPESFRIETLYANPFVPETTPLPNPDGHPPVSFYVALSVTPVFGTQYPPPLIEPPDGTLFPYDSGIIVDDPIVAEIEQAYIVLSGASIVPEPGSLALLCGSLCLLVAARYRVASYWFAVAAVLTLGDTCNAEFKFLPPTPYLSAADSPFPLNSNPTFQLEDFENRDCSPGPGVFCGGDFDVTGVRVISGGITLGSSVDADDGLLDSNGQSGYSGSATPIVGNADLTRVTSIYEVEFEPDTLGFLPNAVGFVWTAGAGPLSSVTVFDSDGRKMDISGESILLSPLTVDDDRFIGFTNPGGISRIMVGRTVLASSADQSAPLVDHLQYGLLVPEPSAGVLLVCGGVLLAFVTQYGFFA